MGPFDNGAGAVAFWMFIAIVAVVGTIIPYLRHVETQKTIRAAIERGQPIEPALLAEPKKQKQDKPEEMMLAGVVLTASGLGLQVLGACIGLQAGQPVWPIHGAGAMCLFLGVALFMFGRWQRRHKAQDGE